MTCHAVGWMKGPSNKTYILGHSKCKLSWVIHPSFWCIPSLRFVMGHPFLLCKYMYVWFIFIYVIYVYIYTYIYIYVHIYIYTYIYIYMWFYYIYIYIFKVATWSAVMLHYQCPLMLKPDSVLTQDRPPHHWNRMDRHCKILRVWGPLTDLSETRPAVPTLNPSNTWFKAVTSFLYECICLLLLVKKASWKLVGVAPCSAQNSVHKFWMRSLKAL